MHVLQQGGNTQIDNPQVVLSVFGDPPQLTELALAGLFLLGANGRASDASMFIAAGRPSPVGAVEVDPSGTGFSIDLTQVPAEVERIVLALMLPSGPQGQLTFGRFKSITTSLNGASGGQLAVFTLSTGGMTEAALVLTEIYRLRGGWKIRAVGQGFAYGMVALARQYGLEMVQRQFEREQPAQQGQPGSDQSRPAGRGAAQTGTGFFVSRDGYFVTNHHVVDGMSEFMASSPRSRVALQHVFSDPRNDLALLKCDTPPPTFAAFRSGPSARLGEGVLTIGYPLSGLLGSGAQVTTGNVSSLIGPGNDTRDLQFTAPVQRGNSGGPLLDLEGAVVGVVSAKLDAAKVHELTGDIPQNVNFAIKASIATSFLDAIGIEWQSQTPGTPRTAFEIAQQAQTFVLRVECRE